MKTKKFGKKLVINKKTVANLNNGDMSNAKGGATYTCEPCDTMLTCHRFCCETFFCPQDPVTNYCFSVAFCTE